MALVLQFVISTKAFVLNFTGKRVRRKLGNNPKMFSNKNPTETPTNDGKLDLLEVMHVFSDLYLTHLLAEEILGEGSWMTAFLPLENNIFFKHLMQVH